MCLVDLWRWNGRVDRRTYAIVGSGFVVKHLLDGLLTRRFLGTNARFLFNYWVPLGISAHIHQAIQLSDPVSGGDVAGGDAVHLAGTGNDDAPVARRGPAGMAGGDFLCACS
jgi:hypothetical protein